MSSDSSFRVTMERNGRIHELQLSQLNTENLRRMFHVSVTEVWLKDRTSDRAYFPESDGTFHLIEIADYTTLTVEGPDLSQSTPLPRRTNPFQSNPFYSSSTSTISSTPSGTSTAPPVFCSVVAPRKGYSFSLKIVKAKMKKGGNRRKVDFESLSQTYIELTESTSNLEHISTIIKRRWGEDYVIVTSDGTELEDSPAAQGVWLFMHTCLLTFVSICCVICLLQ